MTSSKSARCLLLLELKLISIEYILKKKRLNYLFRLLRMDRSHLARQIFDQMIESPIQGDFVNVARQNLEEFNIRLSFDEISSLSKKKFKDMVSNACDRACFDKLIKEKEKLSKGKEIMYEDFEVQEFMKPKAKLSIEEVRRILHIRIRDLDIKGNFPKANESMKCSASKECNEEEVQSHIFDCIYLKPANELIEEKVEYDDIFVNEPNKQIRVMRILFSRLERRKQMHPNHENHEDHGPEDPSDQPPHIQAVGNSTCGSGRSSIPESIINHK